MESNRNLSSIISKIRDEGPPGSATAAPPVAPVSAEPAHSGDTPQAAAAGAVGHRTSRKLLLGLALPLVLIIGLVFFAGNYTGYRSDGSVAGVTGAVRGWFSVSPDTAEDASTAAAFVVDEQLVRELRSRQLDISARLDQLTDTVTALSETINKNWADNDMVVAGLRQEQQVGIDALEARVSALQLQLAGMADKTPAAAARPAPAKPVAQTKKNAPAKPAAQTKKDAPAKTAAQTKKDAPAKTAAQTKKDAPAKTAAQTRQDAPASPVAQTQLTVPTKPAARDTAEQAVAGEEWVVNVASSSHEQAMVELAAKLKKQGIPVERQTLTIEGDLMYRLRVPGFATSDEARSYARQLDKEFALKGGWISRK